MTIICIWVICHNYIFLLIQHLVFLELIMSSFVVLILKNISQTQPKFLQNPKTLNIIKPTRQSIIYSCFSLPLVLSPSCSSLSYILCRIPCSQIPNIVFDYLFLVALGLRCCPWAFSGCGARVSQCGGFASLLLVAELHGCSSQA